MALFCKERLSQTYDRYFDNHYCPTFHPIVCNLHDCSLKLYLYDGEVSMEAVKDDCQTPYYVIVSEATLSSISLNGVCNIYKPFQMDKLGMSSYYFITLSVCVSILTF